MKKREFIAECPKCHAKDSSTYAVGRSREQQLVDLIFSIALTISDSHGTDRDGNAFTFASMSAEEKAAWVAEQLRLCGFPTTPRGASWGILDSERQGSPQRPTPLGVDCSSG